MEVDKGVNIEEGGDASLHDGDMRSHPHSQVEEPDNCNSMVSNAGESYVEERNMPHRIMRDMTPQPQSRGHDIEEGWTESQEYIGYRANITKVILKADGLEEQKEYEARKDCFMKKAPGMITHTREVSDTAKLVANAATKAAQAATEAADELEQLLEDC
jgi:hypothetical protein